MFLAHSQMARVPFWDCKTLLLQSFSKAFWVHHGTRALIYSQICLINMFLYERNMSMKATSVDKSMM